MVDFLKSIGGTIIGIGILLGSIFLVIFFIIERGTVLCFIIDINLANELFDLLIKRVNKI